MNVIEIINNYLIDIQNVVDIMRHEGIKRNPEQSWQKTLNKEGEIKNAQLKYDFHGMGCWVKWKDKIIDFDFRGEPDKGIWGIDSWFCAYYMQSLELTGFKDLRNCQDIILKELTRLEKKNMVIKHDSVYFWKEDYEQIEKTMANNE